MAQDETIVIETAEARVAVLPEFGARVVALVDKRSGRDWMASGGISTSAGEDAVYAGSQAVGWDECFPTVSRVDASNSVWGRTLRDHGDLWGRAWAVGSRSATSLETSFTGTGFRFSRTLTLDGAVLTAEYRLDNIGKASLPSMWALHGLLATRAGETIDLPGVNDVAATYLSLDSRQLDFAQLPWPGLSTAIPFPLDKVQPVATCFAGKFYATNVHAASVGGDGGWLDLAWEGIDHLGIWLSYGAWPVPGDIHHVALEPTTAPVDHLGQALAAGSATLLEPGASTSWRVTMTLRAATSRGPR